MSLIKILNHLLDIELLAFASQGSVDSKARFFESAKKLNFEPKVRKNEMGQKRLVEFSIQ